MDYGSPVGWTLSNWTAAPQTLRDVVDPKVFGLEVPRDQQDLHALGRLAVTREKSSMY